MAFRDFVGGVIKNAPGNFGSTLANNIIDPDRNIYGEYNKGDDPAVDTSGNGPGGLSVTPTTTQSSLSVTGDSTPQTFGATTGEASTSVGGGGAAVAGGGGTGPNLAQNAALRTEVTNLVNSIKNIFNDRYGAVDAAANEQSGNLNSRFASESGQLTDQIGKESEAVGAAHAAGGSYDSSYRSNNQDTVRTAGANQIKDLGEGLKEDMAKIGGYVQDEKAKGAAETSGYDAVVSRLKETTDADELTTIRNQVDARMRELQASAPTTQASNLAALQKIAPSNARAQQLKTTLSQVIGSAADGNTKSTIGERLITAAGLSPDETRLMLEAFQSDLGDKDKEQIQA